MPVLSFRKYKPITPGTYLFEVDAVTENEKGKYGPTLLWKCKIIDDSEENGNFVNYLTSAEFGPKSKTYKFVVKLGCSEEDFVEDSDFDTEVLKGAQFYASVETTDSEGKQYSNFKDIWSVLEMDTLLTNLAGKKKLSIPAKIGAAVTAGQPAMTSAQKPIPKVAVEPEAEPESEPEPEVEMEQEQDLPISEPVQEKYVETVAAAPAVRKINPLLKKPAKAALGVPAGDLGFPKGKK
jgi:hypothetical protein